MWIGPTDSRNTRSILMRSVLLLGFILFLIMNLFKYSFGQNNQITFFFEKSFPFNN